MVNDASFEAALSDILSPKNMKSATAAFKMIDSLAEFNAVFLPAELENLQRAGLEYPIDNLQIAVRERNRTNLKEISAIGVMNNVQTGKDSVCRMASDIVTERQLRAAQWTFGGIILVAADVGVTIGAATLGGPLAVPLGAVAISSIGLGGTAAFNASKGDIP
ncbi:MAG: hypothetical protein QOJ84_1773 [Bradyrhizobium sp.]|nr:hypothetical protein [Bradyrhizobium sp.]